MANRTRKIVEKFIPFFNLYDVLDGMQKKIDLVLASANYNDILVDEIDASSSGDVKVTFVIDDEIVPVIFAVDKGIPIAFIDSENAESAIDLRHFNTPVITSEFEVDFVNLSDTNWINFDFLDALLNDDVEEALTQLVVRDGKKVRREVVRRPISKERLTVEQRAGIRRANIKRKAKMERSLQKREKSLRVRREGNLTKLNRSGHKVGSK